MYRVEGCKMCQRDSELFRARSDSLLSAMGKCLLLSFVISVCISVIFSFYAGSETDEIAVELYGVFL